MPIYQVKTELQYPELLALLDYSRKIQTMQREEEVWPALVETTATFYDNVAVFVPINDHQLRAACQFYRDPALNEMFNANRERMVIDTQLTPLSLVATCFTTRSTTYIKDLTDDEAAQQNRLVIQLLRDKANAEDGVNVPILVGEGVRGVLGCINTSSGYDSLANLALLEVLAHLTSNWFELYERSLNFALSEQMWKDTTLQILHEAFNSLNQSIWSTRLLGRAAGSMPESQAGYLQAMQNSQQHLRRLLNELADFCRLDRGAVPLQLLRYAPERMLQVVEEIVGGLSPDAQARVQVRNCINQPFEVLVDLDRFRQIATNLISNAVKYSSGTIKVSIDCKHPLFAVTVADEGPGIPAEEQPKIFDPYYRVKNKAPTNPSGWGLGLYITKRLVELHKGELELESAPTKGTAFTVKFFDPPQAA